MSNKNQQQFRAPRVSQKVHAKSASNSICNLKQSNVPSAFCTPEALKLYRPASSAARSRDRSPAGVLGLTSTDHVPEGLRKQTVVSLGASTVTLSAFEAEGLAQDIISRVCRQDAANDAIASAERDCDLRRKLLVGFGRRSSFRYSPAASPKGAAARRPVRYDEGSILLFPFVMRRLEQRLEEARLRISARREVTTDAMVVRYAIQSLERRVLCRWKLMLHTTRVGRRACLHRILFRWRKYSEKRNRERQTLYQNLFRAIDKFRLHRVLCVWYVYQVCEKALSADQDPYAAVLKRPLGSDLLQRRPTIVYRTIDASVNTQVKLERLTAAIAHHSDRTVRPMWDTWRMYVFRRRVKRNNQNMLRLYVSGHVAKRVSQRCFRTWKFKMNASRSLSVYLFQLQSHALSTWRQRYAQRLQDRETTERVVEGGGKIAQRFAFQTWRKKTAEFSLMTAIATTRVLCAQHKLLPFAFTLMQRTQPHGSIGQDVAIHQTMCSQSLAQWKRFWQRRIALKRLIKQQHRLHCLLLMKKAMHCWRNLDARWEECEYVSQFFISTTASGKSNAGTGSGDSVVLTPTPPSAGGSNVSPTVTLFGPEIDTAATIPWTSLRAVERYCRRSYASFGANHFASNFSPQNFFTCDLSSSGSRLSLSDTTLALIDAQLTSEQLSNRSRKPLQSFFVTQDDARVDESVPSTHQNFYRFLKSRICQALFVVGRIIIASRQASQRIQEFQDLMFSKHLSLSRERIKDVEEMLSTMAYTSQNSWGSRSDGKRAPSRRDASFDATGELGDVFHSQERLLYNVPLLNAWISERDENSPSSPLCPLTTQNERLMQHFSEALQTNRDTLHAAHKRKLRVDGPSEVLLHLAELGFPPTDRTEVEARLSAISSFLNELIRENAKHRVAFRMRTTFIIKRWTVALAANSFSSAYRFACKSPRPPAESQFNAAGPRQLKPKNGEGVSFSPGLVERSVVVPKETTSTARSKAVAKRRFSVKGKRPNTFRVSTFSAELAALQVAISMRSRQVSRNLRESFTPASIVCLVPPKVIVQTVSRSQNAPDKLLSRRDSSSALSQRTSTPSFIQ